MGKAVRKTQAQQSFATRMAEAKSKLATAESSGLKQKEESLAAVKAKEQKIKINTKQECESLVFAAQARLAAAEAQSEAVVTNAGAEQGAAGKLKIMREHELRMAKMEVLQAMAANNKIVISGEQGDKLINEFLHSSILGDMSLSS